MCLTAPARLVTVDGQVGVVDLDGRRRRASLLLVPDAIPGDWLLVGAGNALRRLDPTEAEELADLIAAAASSADSARPPGGLL
jgi:hydrogenase expression/formation protein HypC